METATGIENRAALNTTRSCFSDLQLQKFEDETLENNEKEGSSSAPRYNAHHEAANVQAAEAVHDVVHTEQSSNLLLFVRVQPG